MSREFNRRDVIKSVGAGAITLSAIGAVTARQGTRYIVTVRGPATHNRIERAGFTIRRELARGDVVIAVGPSAKRDDLEDVRGVKTVAQDYQFRWDAPQRYESASEKTTDDVLFPFQWDKQDITTDVPAAHETATGDGTTLAIIDTGVDVDDHPDLPNVNETKGRLFREGDVRSGTGPVEFPANVADLCAGTTTINDHVADDIFFHGTHVAGIAAASREGTTGVVGTAPDAEIVPLRVFWWTEADYDCDGDDEVEKNAAALGATFGDIITAIDHAADIGADALNMSLGTPPLPPQVNATGIRGALERVIDTATARGTVVVNAAGNDDTNLDGGTVMYPASIAGAMAISATGPNDKRAFYSNYGTSTIDVGAPGGGYETLEKTLTTKSEGDDDGEDEEDVPGVEWPFPTNLVLNASDPDSWIGQLFGGAEYVYAAGTSMATPQVTGTVGLVREKHPTATAETVEKAIEQGAESVTGEHSDDLGAGRLNADKTLDASVLDR